MHELSIVASLFEILVDKAREQSAVRVVLVKLKVGKLSGVVPEFLQSAFELYRKDTIAADSGLEIEVVPIRIKCRRCQAETLKDDFIFVCPACGATDIEIIEGTELVLEKIDLEV
jgi:hydrogenase nickel incorporation protein HypA/HybF